MDAFKLFRTSNGNFVQTGDAFFPSPAGSWDELINQPDLFQRLRSAARAQSRFDGALPPLLAPVDSQEVWAAGVTYLRSKKARMEEAQDAGGGDFYDRVYEAERPELFFKSAGHRVVGQGGEVRIRRDAHWNVPEPEFTLFINRAGQIAGSTIGNDMSSRDIEGENPLYLPQAKVYDGSCALGPGLLVTEEPLPRETPIEIEIRRGGSAAFTGATRLDQIRRSFSELAEFLYREMTFPHGCFLLTGTGIVPPDAFTLQSRDEIAITIPPIGTLTNVVR